MKWINVKELEL